MIALLGAYLTYTLRFSPEELSLADAPGGPRLVLRGALSEAEPGGPFLPFKLLLFALPPGAKDARVEVEAWGEEEVLKAPSLGRFHPEDVPHEDVPITSPLPLKLAELTGLWSFRGVPVAGVKVWPVKIYPDGSIHLFREIRLRLSYSLGEPRPQKLTPAFRDLLRALVVNPEAVPEPQITESNYLIVADSSLIPYLDDFVRWRQLTGHRVFVLSAQEAQRQFPGKDPADAVRNAIKWYYENYSVENVLLVGNKERVPAKMALVPKSSNVSFGDSIYTDYFYACLDGDWNEDNDWYFGDMDEWIDLAPDAFVGRWPVRNPEDLQGLIAKTVKFESEPSSGAADLILHVSNLDDNNSTSIYYANLIRSAVPGWVHEVNLVEGERPESVNITPQEFLDSLNQGGGIFVSICHGNPYFTVIDYSERYYFTWPMTHQLTNSHQPTFAMLLSCFYNDLMDASVGKWALLNPEGGFVATFGSQKEDYADMAYLIFDSLLAHLYRGDLYTAGQLDAAARGSFAYAGWSSMWRRLLVSYELGGDPALQLWRRTPQNISLYLPSSVSDPCTVRVYLGGSPVQGARVSMLTPQGELRLAETNSSGEAVFSDFGLSDGMYYFGARARDYVPAVDSASASVSQGFVIASAVQAETLVLGDTSLVIVNLKNVGNVTALASVKLSPVNSFLEFPVDSVGVLTLDPGQEVPCTLRAYLLDTPQTELLGEFRGVVYTTAETTHVFEGKIPLGIPRLTFLGVQAERQGADSAVRFKAWFGNSGSAPFESLAVLIRGYPNTQLVDSTDTLALLGAGGSGFASFEVKCPIGDTPRVNLYAVAGGDTLYAVFLRVAQGPAPPSLQQVPEFSGARLYWDQIPGARGYVLFRGKGLGSISPLLPQLLDDATFADKGALYPDTFLYQVLAVDSGWRWGTPSNTALSTSNPPHQHVPVDAYLATQSWTLPADLNPYIPGEEGVFTGCDEIELYAVGSDGTVWKVSSGLSGGFTPPAAGDLDWDHRLELVVGDVWGGHVYALRLNGSVFWSYDAPGIFKNPIMLYNFDADSAPEVVVVVKGSDSSFVALLDNDGREIFKTYLDRRVMDGTVSAVGDFNGDGSPDIIVADEGGKVWWIEADGRVKEGYPRQLTTNGRGTSVAGGDLYPEYPGDEFAVITNSGDIWLFWDTLALAHVKLDDGKWDSHVLIAPVVGDSLNVVVVSQDRVYVLNRELSVLYTLNFPSALGCPLASDVSPETPGREIIGGTTEHGIHALTLKGEEALGFPITFADENLPGVGSNYAETPFIADLDRDGLADLHALTRQAAYYSWNLLVPYDSGGWNTFSANRWNTRVYGFKPYDWVIGVREVSRPKALGLRALPSVFKGSLRLSFSLPKEERVRLSVFDLSGRLVKTLLDATLEPGTYRLSAELGVGPGVYFVELRTPAKRLVQRVVKAD